MPNVPIIQSYFIILLTNAALGLIGFIYLHSILPKQSDASYRPNLLRQWTFPQTSHISLWECHTPISTGTSSSMPSDIKYEYQV